MCSDSRPYLLERKKNTFHIACLLRTQIQNHTPGKHGTLCPLLNLHKPPTPHPTIPQLFWTQAYHLEFSVSGFLNLNKDPKVTESEHMKRARPLRGPF